MFYFTFFSRDYLPKAHVVIESILRVDHEAKVICCLLDEISESILRNFPQLEYFYWSDVLASDPALADLLKTRRPADAIFTSVPSMIMHALEMVPPMEQLLYLDADTAMHSSPAQLHKALGSSSVGLFPHHFSGAFTAYFRRYGEFNAGALLLRNDARAKEVLTFWRTLCLEWVEDRIHEGKYSNQKYLEQLDSEFSACSPLPGCGANIAPWNAGYSDISVAGRQVFFRAKPIIFFHYHGLEKWGKIWLLGNVRYLKFLSPSQIRALYDNYLIELEAAHVLYDLPVTKAIRLSDQNLLKFIIDFTRKVLTVATLQTWRLRSKT